MTTEAEPSATMGAKQARTGRDTSGTIHVRVRWRLVIWRLSICPQNLTCGGDPGARNWELAF